MQKLSSIQKIHETGKVAAEVCMRSRAVSFFFEVSGLTRSTRTVAKIRSLVCAQGTVHVMCCRASDALL